MPRTKRARLIDNENMEIQNDRRFKRRYPINLEVRYEVVKNRSTLITGHGTTVDFSSSGISFTGTQPLEVGRYLDVFVQWPVLLNDSCPLQLVASGRVVRSDESGTAMRIDRSEFRTKRSASPAGTAAARA